MKDQVRVFCLRVKSVKTVKSVDCFWGERGEGGEADGEDKHRRQTSVGLIKTEGYTLPLQGAGSWDTERTDYKELPSNINIWNITTTAAYTIYIHHI